MKKTLVYLTLAAVLLGACAKTPKTSKNESARRYLESWMHLNHPDAQKTPLGSYIIEDIPGTGAPAGAYSQNQYVQVAYTVRELSGAVSVTTDERLNKQLGTYNEQGFYGPVVWYRGGNALLAGLEEAVADMRCGGTRTLVIPGWLMGSESTTGVSYHYDTGEEYYEKVTGSTPAIYTITLTDAFGDVVKWESDSLARYVPAHFPKLAAADSVKQGFYYCRTEMPSSLKEFAKDTTIYVNYIGRRLDGVVFDTNIEDTAKFYGLYSASRKYGPAAIKWYSSEGSYKDMEMTVSGSSTSSSVIPGFAFALDQMHPHEKGSAIFSSTWGYGSRSASSAIPAYSPLRFDFEIVDKP